MTTKTHKLYDLALHDRELMPVIAYGTAGTGKTHGACKAAVEWLAKDKRNKVMVIRPNISFAKTNGFLPGSEREKMEPWVRPVSQYFTQFGLSGGQQAMLEKEGRLQYMPLEFIQGLTFDNTFIILDEFQNMDFDQLKGFLTRIGKWSKVVMCGDIAQVSPFFKNSGVAELLEMIEYFQMPIHTIEFTRDDVLRSDICKSMIVAYEEWEKHKCQHQNRNA